jgi:O-antigen ligase
VGAYALVVAFVLTHRGFADAIALAAIPLLLPLLTHPYRAPVVAIALILAVPAWTNLGFSHLDVGRATSLLAATMILRSRGWRPRLLDIALALFVLSNGLSWLLEYREPHAGQILLTEFTPIGFYIGARFLPREGIPTAVIALVIAGTVGALTVIIEYAHGSAIFVSPLTYTWKATDSDIFRPGGVFAGPPDASTVLCFVILFALAVSTRFRGARRAGIVGCIVVCAIALVLTFTRAAFIGAGGGLIVFLWLTRSQLVRPLRLAWIAAGVAIVYFALAPALRSSHTFQAGVVRPGTLSAREAYWQVALPISTTNVSTFLVGLGSGALEAPSVDPTVPEAATVAERPQVTTTSLHSQYVTNLLEQGVVGLAAVVFLMLAAFLPAARTARRTSDPIAAAVAASIVAVATVMVVDTVFFDAASFAMLMFSGGLSARLSEFGSRPLHVRS